MAGDSISRHACLSPFPGTDAVTEFLRTYYNVSFAVCDRAALNQQAQSSVNPRCLLTSGKI